MKKILLIAISVLMILSIGFAGTKTFNWGDFVANNNVTGNQKINVQVHQWIAAFVSDVQELTFTQPGQTEVLKLFDLGLFSNGQVTLEAEIDNSIDGLEVESLELWTLSEKVATLGTGNTVGIGLPLATYNKSNNEITYVDYSVRGSFLVSPDMKAYKTGTSVGDQPYFTVNYTITPDVKF